MNITIHVSKFSTLSEEAVLKYFPTWNCTIQPTTSSYPWQFSFAQRLINLLRAFATFSPYSIKLALHHLSISSSKTESTNNNVGVHIQLFTGVSKGHYLVSFHNTPPQLHFQVKSSRGQIQLTARYTPNKNFQETLKAHELAALHYLYTKMSYEHLEMCSHHIDPDSNWLKIDPNYLP